MRKIKEAFYYSRKDNGKLMCRLCPHNCLIAPGKHGLCRVRINKEGKLFTENYAMISSLNIDPIEKKPLYHYYPGTEVFSIGSYGCNLACQYCQNWQISQVKPSLREIPPALLVEAAKKTGSPAIAYTYSEPSVWYEYIRDTAPIAREAGLKNIMITNAYISTEALEDLIPYLDAVNVDLKAFSGEFYRKYCRGSLTPVLENIRLLYRSGVHIELTTLLINGYNDSRDEIRDLLSWVKSLSPDIPVHFSRYFPAYRFEEPATQLEKMKEIFQLAEDHLNFVYLGNVNLEAGNDTSCPVCDCLLIKRNYYQVKSILKKAECPECGQPVYGKY